MCKVYNKSQVSKLTESLQKLTGKTIKLESKKDCDCCKGSLKEAEENQTLEEKIAQKYYGVSPEVLRGDGYSFYEDVLDFVYFEDGSFEMTDNLGSGDMDGYVEGNNPFGDEYTASASSSLGGIEITGDIERGQGNNPAARSKVINTDLTTKTWDEDNINESKEVIEESYPSEMDSYPRPSKMAKPDISGMTKSATSYWPSLYIQDEARDILVDKYGKERGEKTFDGLLNARRGGAFYQAVTEVVMEKYKMLEELVKAGLMTSQEAFKRDYFENNYFAIWSMWMDELKKKPYSHLIKQADSKEQDKPVQQATQVVKPARQRVSGYDAKDEQRIYDIITKAKGNKSKAMQLASVMANRITDVAKAERRGNAAESDNYHDLAKIFFDRADELSESVVEEGRDSQGNYYFDFEEFMDTDLNGMSQEMAIDELITSVKETINTVIDKEMSIGAGGLNPQLVKKRAAQEVARLWKDKIDQDLVRAKF